MAKNARGQDLKRPVVSEKLKGNTNAEVWDEERSIDLLNKAIALSELKEDQSYKFDFIGEVARELGTYHHNLTQTIPNRFPHLKPLVTQLIANLESNCYFNTKKGHIREATGIVNLKSNHGWTDRVQQETKHTGSISIDKWLNDNQST
ncbi:MAG TPA: hypothetical protein VFV37_11035 [Luteibaculaceae bacterium]|nr:hypothetical protein [Luteibaculaceae bacterium]